MARRRLDMLRRRLDVPRRCAAGLLVCVASCGDETIVVSTTVSSGSSAASESGSQEPDLPTSDLPPEPDCPAALGEIVTCECAVVEGCSIPNAESDNGCEFACPFPSPCPNTSCEGNLEIDGPTGCELNLDVDALQCVFDALADRQPIGWRTVLRASNGFVEDTTWYEYRRLDTTTYARFAGHRVWWDFNAEFREYSFGAFELPESDWMSCEALADEYARFDCMHGLGDHAEPCADPALLLCP